MKLRISLATDWSAIKTSSTLSKQRTTAREPWWYALFRSHLFESGFELTLRALFKLRLHGVENIPKSRPLILCFNHGSHYDAFLMLAVGRRVLGKIPAGITWEGMLKYPVVGSWLRAWGAVPMSSSRHGVANRSAAMRQMIRSLRNGHTLLIACEGKRRDTLGPFRPGAAMVAARTGTLIVPCSLCGVQPLFNELPWPKKYWGNVEVYFHPALDPKTFATVEEMTDAIRMAVASCIDYPKEEDAH
jgi:1-acyl-sn-glycerol-3-phosphate acyltransferase